MRPVLPLLLGLAFAPAAAAQDLTAPPRPDPRGTVSLQVENDVIGNTDRYYTNGLQLTWRSPSADLPAPLAWLDRQLAFVQGPGALRWGVAAGHSIFTPRNTTLANPNPNDRPYAGLLYGAVSLTRNTGTSFSIVELQAGVVGPSAGGEWVQNEFHSRIGSPRARGWDYQLRDEFVAALLWNRIWRVPLLDAGVVQAELLPSATVSLGNLQTYAGVGGMLRIGRMLDADFGPPRIRPALSGSQYFQPTDNGLGWYLFAGAEGRAVANDITLDGNTWRDSRGVDRRPLVGDLQAGLALIWRGVRISYTQVWRSEEFYGQRGGFQQFGSLSASFRF